MNSVGELVESVNGAPTAWPLAVVLFVAFVLVVVLLNGRRLFTGTRNIAESFWCPFKSQLVQVEFEIDAWGGQRIDVAKCSAFTPPTAMTCDKRCARPAPAAIAS